MHTIGQICKNFGISRSTLIYYDSIGLLKPAVRTEGNYRAYSENEIERLEKIILFREAGVSLKDIKTIFDSPQNNLPDILNKRLVELKGEMNKVKSQQQCIVELLKNGRLPQQASALNKDSFVLILKAIGLNDQELKKFHMEFERLNPEEHQDFLEILGASSNEINSIRKYAQELLNAY